MYLFANPIHIITIYRQNSVNVRSFAHTRESDRNQSRNRQSNEKKEPIQNVERSIDRPNGNEMVETNERRKQTTIAK